MVKTFYDELNRNNNLSKFVIDAYITENNVIHLKGKVDEWQDVVDIGHIAGRIANVRGVINDIEAKNIKYKKIDNSGKINLAKEMGQLAYCDIVIIGGGVIGSGIARELSKYDLKIIVVEKLSDLAAGTTKANNGMIHSGFDSKTGSLKAKMNVEGNALYDDWSKELGFRLKRTGSFVAGFDLEDDEYLEMYLERGVKNGVPGIEILSAVEARKFESNLHSSIKKVLWTPSAAYVEPYEVTIALAENAVDNGVQFILETEVLDIEVKNNNISNVLTDKGYIETSTVINAAGLFADDIAEMVKDRFYTIHPRRGSLVIFDKNNKGVVERFIGTPPKNFTKGGGPTQTPEGNPLWGPSAKEVPYKDDLSVDQEDLDFILNKCSHLAQGIKINSVITYFSGLRASNYIEDFIIEPSRKINGFIHVSGIQSPGLASAPAIAKRVEYFIKDMYPNITLKENYNPIREKITFFRECSHEEQGKLIEKNPLHGHIICRCETVTEAEIRDAINGKIPATTIDAVKRRTRAGMGRCQGGFCGPRILEMIAEELDVSSTKVTQKGKGSRILIKPSRGIALKNENLNLEVIGGIR